jgi:hypothetical protein
LEWDSYVSASGAGQLARAAHSFLLPSTVNPNPINLDNTMEVAGAGMVAKVGSSRLTSGTGRPLGTRRGSQEAFSLAAEESVAGQIGISRNTLGKAGDTIPGSGKGGVRYPEFPVHGPNGTLMKRGSIVEVKASRSGDSSSGLSTRDRAQVRDYIQYARELRRRASAETDSLLREKMANVKVELFTDFPAPTKGEFNNYIKEGVLEWKPIPRN